MFPVSPTLGSLEAKGANPRDVLSGVGDWYLSLREVKGTSTSLLLVYSSFWLFPGLWAKSQEDSAGLNFYQAFDIKVFFENLKNNNKNKFLRILFYGQPHLNF